MTKQPIITGIAPWLNVRSTKKAVAFYKAAFNAIETYRVEDPDGNAVVKLEIDNAIFWLSDTPSDNNEAENIGGETVRMILTVADPELFFKQALRAGAKEINLIEEAHGWRIGRLQDPFGLHWEIGFQIIDE